MVRLARFQEFTKDPRLLVCQQNVPAPSKANGAAMVEVTGLQAPGPEVGVGVLVGPVGVFVTVGVGVAVGPIGVLVRVGVSVGVLVGPIEVFVGVGVLVTSPPPE